MLIDGLLFQITRLLYTQFKTYRARTFLFEKLKYLIILSLHYNLYLFSSVLKQSLLAATCFWLIAW